MLGRNKNPYEELLRKTIIEFRSLLEDYKKKKVTTKGQIHYRFMSIREDVYENYALIKGTELEERIREVNNNFDVITTAEECNNVIAKLTNSLEGELNSKKAS